MGFVMFGAQVERGVINLSGAKVQYSKDKQKGSGVSRERKEGGRGEGRKGGGGIISSREREGVIL